MNYFKRTGLKIKEKRAHKVTLIGQCAAYDIHFPNAGSAWEWEFDKKAK